MSESEYSGEESEDEFDDVFGNLLDEKEEEKNLKECSSCLAKGKFIRNHENQLICPSCGILQEDNFTQREVDEEDLEGPTFAMRKVKKTQQIQPEIQGNKTIIDYYNGIRDNLLEQMDFMIEELKFSFNIKYFFINLWEKMLQKIYKYKTKSDVKNDIEIRCRKGRKRKYIPESELTKEKILEIQMSKTAKKKLNEMSENLKNEVGIDVYLKLRSWHTILILYYTILQTREPYHLNEFAELFVIGKIPYKVFANKDHKGNQLLKEFYKDYLLEIPSKSYYLVKGFSELINDFNLKIPKLNAKAIFFKFYKNILFFPIEGCYSVDKMVENTCNVMKFYLGQDDCFIDYQKVTLPRYSGNYYLGCYVILTMKIMFGLMEKETKIHPFIDKLSKFLMKKFDKEDLSVIHQNSTVLEKNEVLKEIIDRIDIEEVSLEHSDEEMNLKWEEDENLSDLYVFYPNRGIEDMHYQTDYFIQILCDYLKMEKIFFIRHLRKIESAIIKNFKKNGQKIEINGEISY